MITVSPDAGPPLLFAVESLPPPPPPHANNGRVKIKTRMARTNIEEKVIVSISRIDAYVFGFVLPMFGA